MEARSWGFCTHFAEARRKHRQEAESRTTCRHGIATRIIASCHFDLVSDRLWQVFRVGNFGQFSKKDNRKEGSCGGTDIFSSSLLGKQLLSWRFKNSWRHQWSWSTRYLLLLLWSIPSTQSYSVVYFDGSCGWVSWNILQLSSRTCERSPNFCRSTT